MDRTAVLLFLTLSSGLPPLLAQSPAAQHGGGPGRGDSYAVFQPPPLASSIHGGGTGRGDGNAAFLPAALTTAAHAGGFGRGDGAGALVLLPPISTVVAIDSLCAGTPIIVSFQTNMPFFAGNVFTAQLSDAAGSFSAPVSIGNVAGLVGGTIEALIPANTPDGTGYRVRVVGGQPQISGSDNGADIIITPQSIWHFDGDGDGLGDPLVVLSACTQPAGYVANALDDCPLAPGIIGSSCAAANDCGPTVLSASCDCIPVDPCSGIFGGAVGRGDALAFVQPLPLFSSIHEGGIGRGDAIGNLLPAPLPSSIHGGGTGRGDDMTALVLLGPSMGLALRVTLEGPYDPNTGLMSDALRGLASFPLSEPYSALGHQFQGGGGETTTQAMLDMTGNNAIVDWVVVEVRSAAAPGQVVASRAALIQRDGDVVDVDGQAAIGFQVAPALYTVAVLHRNHLGIMTKQPVTFSPLTLVDLTAASTETFGTDGRRSINGSFPTNALWAGDVNFDGTLKYTGQNNDRDPILNAIGGVIPTATATGYLGADVNLDGTVKYTGESNDRDIILQNVGGVVPTNIRLEQLP